MSPQQMSDGELVHHVDNLPTATDLERVLAERLYSALQRIRALEDQRFNSHD